MCLRALITEYQWEITKLVAEGEKDCDIAKILGRTKAAIKAQIRLIYDKIGVWSRLELSLIFVRHDFDCVCQQSRRALCHSDMDRDGTF